MAKLHWSQKSELLEGGGFEPRTVSSQILTVWSYWQPLSINLHITVSSIRMSTLWGKGFLSIFLTSRAIVEETLFHDLTAAKPSLLDPVRSGPEQRSLPVNSLRDCLTCRFLEQALALPGQIRKVFSSCVSPYLGQVTPQQPPSTLPCPIQPFNICWMWQRISMSSCHRPRCSSYVSFLNKHLM